MTDEDRPGRYPEAFCVCGRAIFQPQQDVCSECAVSLDTAARDRLMALLKVAGDDEIRVMAYIAERLIGIGQIQYGKLSIANDRRDFRREAAMEFGDAAVYLTLNALRMLVAPR